MYWKVYRAPIKNVCNFTYLFQGFPVEVGEAVSESLEEVREGSKSGKSKGVVLKTCSREVPRVINQTVLRGAIPKESDYPRDLPWGNCPDNH